jgi:hypothetical protein
MKEELSINQVIALFAAVCDSGVPLTDVYGQYLSLNGPPDLIALRLEFGDQSVLLTAMEDDSLKVSANQALEIFADHTVRQLTHISPWKDAVSRPLMWAWTMVNQQGYFDGIQLEFAESSEEEATRIQLLVIASSLKPQP